MFFLFGSPRSGTTLLAQALSAHPAVVIPYETDFIIPMAFVLDRMKDAATGKNMIAALMTESAQAASLLEYLPKEEIARIVEDAPYEGAAILAALYGQIARRAGKKIAGDKSPNDLLFLRMAVKTGCIGPEAKIIHLVRDVRAVMASLRKTGWLPDGDGYFPRFWASSNLYLHGLYREQPTRYHFLRYEDFAADPETHLRALASFLGVDYAPAMLETRGFHPRYKDIPHHASLYQAIAPRGEDFRATLGPSLCAAYERQASEALDAFGYLKPKNLFHAFLSGTRLAW